MASNIRCTGAGPRGMIGAVVLLIVGLSRETAHADNLGGLVFLLCIWPAGIILFILLSVFCALSVKRNIQNDPSRGPAFSRAVIIFCLFGTVAFAIFTVGLKRFFDARASLAMIIITIAPVGCAALVCLALNWNHARRRGSGDVR